MFFSTLTVLLPVASTPIPAAIQGLHKLTDGDGHFDVPVAFVTNGCSKSADKAKLLSKWTGIEVSILSNIWCLLINAYIKMIACTCSRCYPSVAHLLVLSICIFIYKIKVKIRVSIRFKISKQMEYQKRQLSSCQTYFPGWSCKEIPIKKRLISYSVWCIKTRCIYQEIRISTVIKLKSPVRLIFLDEVVRKSLSEKDWFHTLYDVSKQDAYTRK